MFDKFVQINIENNNDMLSKILKYAKKHFQKQYQLSTSILILDDGERFKKDYLINWAYHISMQSQKDSLIQGSLTLEMILRYSYLPIRIKITSSHALLERVKISFKTLGVDRAVLTLDRPNHIVKRYINSLLGHFILASDVLNIFMDTTNRVFWVSLANMIGNKIIHNIRLEFDYDSFKLYKFGKKSFRSSYLTSREQRLKKAYATLNCKYDDDIFTIKSNYLELIKQYHPDRVFNKDKTIIDAYNIKFLEIKEAFDLIKDNLEGILYANNCIIR